MMIVLTMLNGKSIALRCDDIIRITECVIEGKRYSEIMCNKGDYIVKELLSVIVKEINIMNYRKQVRLFATGEKL